MGIIKHFQDYPEDTINKMVEERYPIKVGFGSINEEERDAYRQGLEEGFQRAKLDDY